MKSLHQSQSTPLSWQRLALFALWVILAIVLCSAIVYGALFFIPRRVQPHPVQQLRQKEEFPAIDMKKLSPIRAKIITTAHQQFDTPQPGVQTSLAGCTSRRVCHLSTHTMVVGASLVCVASKRTIARLVAGTQPIVAIHPSQAMPSSTTQPVSVVNTLIFSCATKMANSPPLVATKATQSTLAQSSEQPLAKFVALVRQSRIRIFSTLSNR